MRKTTLSKQFIEAHNIPKINIFDLENPLNLAILNEPMLALSDLKGFIIIDEIQYKPRSIPYFKSSC